MTTQLTARFQDALTYAFNLHNGQLRKSTLVPYFSHLMAVSAIVLEDGGSEDEAIAGLLHDGPEDRGGLATLQDIRARFGETVARIVEGLSDSLVDTKTEKKADWRERKERYLEHLRSAPADEVRVSLADKLHNARTIVTGLRADGNAVWERFKGKKAGSLWYYEELVEIFCQKRENDPLVAELADLVTEMKRFASQ